MHEASNARSGLIMAANHPPDLVILDLGLPDMNGHAVLRDLTSRERHALPVIIF